MYDHHKDGNPTLALVFNIKADYICGKLCTLWVVWYDEAVETSAGGASRSWAPQQWRKIIEINRANGIQSAVLINVFVVSLLTQKLLSRSFGPLSTTKIDSINTK